MPRSIDEIKADIARTQAEINMRNQYTQGFNQPQTRVGWGSYIVNNDRGLLDAYQNREAQWKLAKEQQEFQALQNEEQRKLTEAIAKMNAAKSNNGYSAVNEFLKLSNAIEMAEADFEAARNSLDAGDAQSIANYKKMASKLNYLYKQLPKDIKGIQLIDLNEELSDSQQVRIAKNKKWLDAHKDRSKLTEEDSAKYDKLMAELPEEEQEIYKVVKEGKGSTVEESEKEELRNLRKLNNASLLDSTQRNRLATLEKKYPGVK